MTGLLFALLVPEPPGSRRTVLRDRLADALTVLLALAYGAATVPLGDAMSPSAFLPWPVDVAIGTACCVALLARRRWPVALAAALIPVSAVSVMACGAATAALFTVAIRRRTSIAILLFLVFVATGPVYHELHGASAFPVWVDLTARLVTGTAALGWGKFVGAYRGLARSLRARADQALAEQQLRMEQARLMERTRIAREMHDVLAHRISLISLHAGALSVRPDADAREVTTTAEAIRSSAHDALRELRAVIGLLRDDTAAGAELPQPDLGDLHGLVVSARESGMTVEYRCDPLVEQVSVLLGRTAYRLVQEGLTNARKHAPGGHVDIVVGGIIGEGLEVEIVNSFGHATSQPEPLPGAGMGLVGITERVEMAGGHVEYGARQDQFRLRAQLPWLS
ncbi:sensor histidine kinase [Symbioplanes lichenis]|uniref:sensor histidine kinase n=1 Tax=Symbioplanes lichenis TaxID=1629072 RepID=UPI0027382A23|nr:histidine kinase [Actinoplanes lichenis]